MSGRRLAGRVLRVGAAALVLVGTVGTLRTVAADAQEATTTFSLRARADTVGLQVIAKEAPAVSIGGGEVVFLTPSSSQSELDSLGNARSFASAPYPGDLVVSLPATVSGLLGGTRFPVPGYPFYVESSYPVTPEDGEEVGPYGIEAHSAEHATDAEARIGLSTAPPQVLSITSRTSVQQDPATGRATADAVAEVAPLSVSELVRVGDVRATAHVAVDPAHPDHPSVASSLSIGTITVAGIELGLTDHGLSVGGTTLLPVDLSAVSSALQGAGVQIEYVPEVRTATSITSAGVRITFQQDLPTLGQTTVRLVLGQVTAAVDPGAGIGGVAPTTVPVVDGTAALPPTVVDGPVAAELPPVAAPGGGARTPAATVPRTQLVSEMAGADLDGLYTVLALCGLLALVASRGTTWWAARRRRGGAA